MLIIFLLAVAVFFIAAHWRVYVKAGQPGWAVLIPIYNIYVLCKIVGKPGWWVFLCLIPFVNCIIIVMLLLGLAERFGRGVGFGLGLILLPIVFYPILAFGSSSYDGMNG